MKKAFWTGATVVLVVMGMARPLVCVADDEVKLAVRVTAIITPKGSTQRFQSKNKKAINKINNEKEDIVTISTLRMDPTVFRFTGAKVGVSKITVTTDDGTEEVVYIVVVEEEKEK